MASVSDWIEGARLRTLPAAAAPVIVGSAAAHYLGGFSAVRAALALLVALAAIIVDRAFERLTRWISRHRHAQ